MSIEARVNPTWAMKWKIMALVLLGWSAYCFYDGLVGYPAHDNRVAKSREYKEETSRGSGQWKWRSDQAKLDWAAYAKSQGWSDADPGEPHSDQDYYAQWWQPALCISGAVAALVMVIVTSRRKLVADETGLTGTDGVKVPYDAITSIDKARWDSKGIAIVHWDDDGKVGKTKIDDWVYRDGEKVLEEVEKQTGLDGVVEA